MAKRSSDANKQPPASPASRPAQSVNLLLFMVGVLAIAVTLNFFAQRGDFRQRIDATKTRAYSLSEQSRRMLESLQGEWAIALIMSHANVDQASERQIDEVLERYVDASNKITILRIDPADPKSLDDYEGLVSDLRHVYQDEIKSYDAAINGGLDAFTALRSFVQQQSAVLRQVVELMPQDDPARAPLAQRTGPMMLLAEQSSKIFEAVEKARQTDESKPIPDYETARSILADALSSWAVQLDELAGIFSRWRERPNIDENVRKFTTNSIQAYSEMSQLLAEAADPLKQLEPLELSNIGEELQKGEAVVVVGPKRAAIIPSWQLFPKNYKAAGEGVVTYDQRFRGEQIISSTIRSLIVDHMPKVVFVHAGNQSLLRRQEVGADLVGAASVLKASRYDVEEWMLGGTATGMADRPTASKGQPIVWIVLPPAQRVGLQPDKSEQLLLTTTQQLLEEGQAVFVNLYPSLISHYGQVDPWSALLEPLGLKVETGQVIYQRIQGADARNQVQRGAAIQEYSQDHIIGRAIAGQQGYFSLPLAIELAEMPADCKATVIGSIAPDPSRWVEKNWAVDPATLPEPSEEQVLEKPAAILVAVERSQPNEPTQRAVVAGSAGWVLRFIAQQEVSLGGGRTALEFPGNYELLLASVAWLANMDDLIAASPLSQSVTRLGRIPDAELTFWRYFLTIGMPLACLVVGLIVHLRRS